MGCRIIKGTLEGPGDHPCAVFYCSTTDWAFGPVMQSDEEATAFLVWLGDTDPRTLTDSELLDKYVDFQKILRRSGKAFGDDHQPERTQSELEEIKDDGL